MTSPFAFARASRPASLKLNLKSTPLRSAAGSERVLRMAVVAVMLAILSALSLPLQAWGLDAGSYQTARAFLDSKENATSILDFVHFGADYHGHEFLKETGVNDGYGNPIPDQVALIYRYHWEDDGVTDIAFFVNQDGKIVGTSIVSTNAELSQPFFLANLSIQVVGRMVINSNDQMTDADRRLALKLVDDADAHGLLNLWLRLQ